MTLYPGAIDDGTTLPNPSSTSKTNNPSHASLHDVENDAIKAVETKLGTGSSTPAANTLLRGSGTGTSAWSTLTSAQLAASISDETGSGAAVFATTPTLVTPKVDTINEATTSNGTTIGGVNIKSGVIQTANSVQASNLQNTSVTASKLSTGSTAAFVATSETTTSTSYVDLATTTDSVTVTIGANGLALVAIYAGFFNSASNASFVSFAVSGSTTTAANDSLSLVSTTTNGVNIGATFLITGLNTGSTTFKMKYRVAAGTATYLNRRISVVPL